MITASGLPFVSSARASSGDSTTTIWSGPLALRPDHLDVVRGGRRARRGGRCRRSGAPRRAPSRRAGRRRRRRCRPRRSQFSRTAGATPCAERTQIAPGGHLVLVVDEDGAEPLEPADDVVVVDDVVADVDRRAVLLEQPLDDLDRAVDAGAERARRGEQDAAHSAAPSRAPSARGGRRASARRRRGRLARRAPSRKPERARAAVGRDRLRRAGRAARSGVSLIARTQPRRRPVAASTPLSMSTASAPVALVQAAALGRVVDEPVDGEDRPRPRARDAEPVPLPEHGAVLVDDRGSRRSPCRSRGRSGRRRRRTRRARPPGRRGGRRRRPGRCGSRPAARPAPPGRSRRRASARQRPRHAPDGLLHARGRRVGGRRLEPGVDPAVLAARVVARARTTPTRCSRAAPRRSGRSRR